MCVYVYVHCYSFACLFSKKVVFVWTTLKWQVLVVFHEPRSGKEKKRKQDESTQQREKEKKEKQESNWWTK